MTLAEINNLWDEYKEKYDIDEDVKITDVCYDTDEYVEGSFDLFELLRGEYILHLNPRFHLYSENYIKFILFHEFTHFYDFIKCDIEDRQDFFIYMNAYSEYHACRVTLARFIEQLTITSFDVDKIQIPGPFKEISVRKLITEALYRVKFSYASFHITYDPSEFVATFRQLMYLFGYLSLFQKDEYMVTHSLAFLGMENENYYKLYQELKKEDVDVDQILFYTREVYNSAFLEFIREFIRRNYDDDLYTEEELDELTTDNYQEFIDALDDKMDEFYDAQAAFEAHFIMNYGSSLFPDKKEDGIFPEELTLS